MQKTHKSAKGILVFPKFKEIYIYIYIHIHLVIMLALLIMSIIEHIMGDTF